MLLLMCIHQNRELMEYLYRVLGSTITFAGGFSNVWKSRMSRVGTTAVDDYVRLWLRVICVVQQQYCLSRLYVCLSTSRINAWGQGTGARAYTYTYAWDNGNTINKLLCSVHGLAVTTLKFSGLRRIKEEGRSRTIGFVIFVCWYLPNAVFTTITTYPSV